jgi:hypothetical protein
VEFDNDDFMLLVKRTRQKFGVSIDEAHDMIFADEEMRRLVAWRQPRPRVPEAGALGHATQGQ